MNMKMKKFPIMLFTVIIIIFVPLTVKAEFYFDLSEKTYSLNEYVTEKKVSPDEDDTARKYLLTKVDGKLYEHAYETTFLPRPFDEKISKLFYEKTNKPFWDYVWTGEGYIARNYVEDGQFYVVGYADNSLCFFDSDVNLIKEVDFGGQAYITQIDYFNGIYYCSYQKRHRGSTHFDERTTWGEPVDLFPAVYGTLLKDYVVMSTDTEHWTEIDEMPKHNNNVVWQSNKISIANQKAIDVVYESETPEYRGRFGKWFAFQNDRDVLYLSNDNVNFLKIIIPNIDFGKNLSSYGISGVYELDGNIIFTSFYANGYAFITPSQPIYEELDRLREAPYIKLNDRILSFDEAPVVESSRTLVPIRFLLEQMGDSVSWNDESQSATVQGKNNVVTFSVGETIATVNGEHKNMDIPAKLINDKTMVPLRFLTEELGYTVEWDEETNIVSIVSK